MRARLPKWKLAQYTKDQPATATSTSTAEATPSPGAADSTAPSKIAATHVLIDASDSVVGPALSLQAASAAAVYCSGAGEEAMLQAMPGGAECWAVGMHFDTHLPGQCISSRVYLLRFHAPVRQLVQQCHACVASV